MGRFLNLHHYLKDKDTKYCPCCRGTIKLNEYNKHISKHSPLSLQTLSESTIASLPNPKLGQKLTMTILKAIKINYATLLSNC